MKRARYALAALAATPLLLTGCTIDGTPVATGQGDTGGDSKVDTDRYDNLLLECNILSDSTIAKVVGGAVAQGTFVGAICRVDRHRRDHHIGDIHLVRIGQPSTQRSRSPRNSATPPRTSRSPVRRASHSATQDSAKCGVTARALSRGVFTWWDRATWRDPADPCAAPTKLMELVLSGGQ